MSFEQSALLLAWIAIALLAFALAGLLRQLAALQGEAPALEQPMRGARIAQLLPEPLRSSGPSIVMFVDQGCTACEQLARAYRGWVSERGANGSVGFVYSDQPDQQLAQVAQVAGPDKDLFDELRIPATPFGIRLDRQGRVIEGRAIGSVAAFEEFIKEAQR